MKTNLRRYLSSTLQSISNFSVITLTKLAAPHLTKTKGNVVNVSSVGGQRGSAMFQPYVISKAALDHFTRNAALEYADKAVRVNTVRLVTTLCTLQLSIFSPGATHTAFLTRNMDEKIAEKLYKTFEDNMIPLRRVGSSHEIANVVVFLASDLVS